MGSPALIGWDVCILSYISMKYYRWKKAVKKNLPGHKTEDCFEVFKIISTCHSEPFVAAYVTWSQNTALSMLNLTLKQFDYKERDRYVLVLWERGEDTDGVLIFKDVSSLPQINIYLKLSVPLDRLHHELWRLNCQHSKRTHLGNFKFSNLCFSFTIFRVDGHIYAEDPTKTCMLVEAKG